MHHRIQLFALFLLLATGIQAQPSPFKYSLVKVYFTSGHQVQDLAKLGLETDHGTIASGRFLINVFSQDELAGIQAAGFQYTVQVDDMEAYYLEHQNDPAPVEDRSASCPGPKGFVYPTPVHYTNGTMGGYYKWEELLAVMDQMRAAYPQLISARTSVSDTLLTAQGRPIYWMRISNSPDIDQNKPKALFTALHHAREPNSITEVVFFMWYLLEHYTTDPEIKYLIDNSELFFMPCLNPDGYVYNQTVKPNGGGYWRKNMGSNGGVDLNRNYGFNWGLDDVGSSPDSLSEVYRGPAPFSEPETRAVRFFCNSHNVRVSLNAHTYGNYLIYPTGLTTDSTDFAGIARLMVQENGFVDGNDARTVGYAVNGDSDSWMHDVTQQKAKIYALTPEVGPSFWPVPSQIDGLNKSMMWTNLTLVRLLHNFGVAVSSDPKVLYTPSGYLHFDLKRLGLENGSLTASVQAVSSNVLSQGGPKSYNLAPFGIASDSFAYQLSGSILPGSEVVFLLTVNNGIVLHSDTLRFTFKPSDGIGVPVLTEHGANLTQWNTVGGWGTTTEQFVSPPTSITDSPYGQYPLDSVTTLYLSHPIDLTHAVNALLTFYARWSIEQGFDYAQVVASTDGVNYLPLCGKYTVRGGGYQDPGQPLYDGKSPGWVFESMDLGDFTGSHLYLGFKMVSDLGVQDDGFYFDDLLVKAVLETGTADIRPQGFGLDLAPNPASDRFRGRLILPEGAEESGFSFQVYDAIGHLMECRMLAGKELEVDTRLWPAGIYFFRMRSAAGVMLIKPFIVGH
jgi:hypothetical protein